MPEILRAQYRIQNGGSLAVDHPEPFSTGSIHWMNAAVDGLRMMGSWESVTDIEWLLDFVAPSDLWLLICIAQHSESYLCLDYRNGRGEEMPAVIYLDTVARDEQILTVSVELFVQELIELRPA